MDENPNQKSNSAVTTLKWLGVGLAPILISLLVMSQNGPSQGWEALVLLFICVICNLLGGFGCTRNIKDTFNRIFLGLFLAVSFFAVSAIVAILDSCSHMQF
jgi:FtsH-binding integral membrane protein